MKKRIISVLSILTVIILAISLGACAKKSGLRAKKNNENVQISWDVKVNFEHSKGTSALTEYAIYEEIDWSEVSLRKKETVGKSRKTKYGDPVPLAKEDITNFDEIERAIDKEQTIDKIPYFRGYVKFVKDGIKGSFMLSITRKRYVFPVNNYFIVPKTSDTTVGFTYTGKAVGSVPPGKEAVMATTLSSQKKWQVIEDKEAVGKRFLKEFSVSRRGYNFLGYDLTIFRRTKGSSETYTTEKQLQIRENYNLELDFKDVDDEYEYMYRFTAILKEDTFERRFNLNLPDDRELEDGQADPAEISPVKVNRVTGNKMGTEETATLPTTSYMNKYKSHIFVAWARKVNGEYKEYKFESNTETQGIVSIYAIWKKREYDFTLYSLGGNLGREYEDANAVTESAEDETKGVEVEAIYASNQYQPASYKISKIKYGTEIGDIVARFEIFNDRKDKKVVKKLKVADLMAGLQKSEGASIASWHTSVPFLPANTVDTTRKINLLEDHGKGKEIYPFWQVDNSKLSTYIIESVFHNRGDLQGHRINEDGTVSLLKVRDKTISELIIPRTVTINGVERKVVEVGGSEGLTWLSKIDFSATEIETIADYAFAKCESLKDVKLSEKITHIGEGAFNGTKFIANAGNIVTFDMEGGKKYLYKATTDGDTIDLHDQAIKTIGISAFDNFKKGQHELGSVKKVILNGAVENIKKNAFSYLTNLEEIEIQGAVDLKDIDQHALDGTKLLKDKADNKQDIVIGNALFKVTNPDLIEYTIPAGVNVIAEYAFSSCKGLETINNISQITHFGQHALDSCDKFLDKNKNEEGLVVINNILIANRVSSKQEVIHVDENVKEIASGALTVSNPEQLKEAYIYSNNIKISRNAFEKNAKLSKVVFVSKGDTLADNITLERGSIPSGVEIYVRKNVKDKLTENANAQNISEIASTITRIYKENINKFKELVEKEISINYNKIEQKYLRRATTFKIIDEVFKMGDEIAKGLLIACDGLTGKIYATLKKADVATALDPANLSTEGEKSVELTITEKKTTFEYRVVNAPDESKQITVEGLESTYYTSNINIDISKANIVYRDIDDVEKKIKITDEDIASYKPEVADNKRFIFRLNIPGWGICQKADGSYFEVVHEYSVHEAQIKDIKQINRLEAKYRQGVKVDNKNVKFKLIKEDGEYKVVSFADEHVIFLKKDGTPISEGDKEENKVIEATELGFHTIEFKYVKDGKEVFGKYVYSVIFEPDYDVFEYDVRNNSVKIKKVNNQHNEVVVVPSRVRINGIEYEVDEIGSEAFLNQTDITKVYIPNTIKKINDGAFNGCSSLESVQLYDVSALTDENYLDSDVFETVIMDKEERHNTEIVLDGYQNLDDLTGNIRIPKRTIIKNTIHTLSGLNATHTYEHRFEYNARVRATLEFFEDNDDKLVEKKDGKETIKHKVEIPKTQFYLDLLEIEYETETITNANNQQETIYKFKLNDQGKIQSRNQKIQEKFTKDIYSFYETEEQFEGTDMKFFSFSDDYKTQDPEPTRRTKHYIKGINANLDTVLDTYQKVVGKHIVVSKELKDSTGANKHTIVGYAEGVFDVIESKLTVGGKLYLPDTLEPAESVKNFIYSYSDKAKQLNETEDMFSDKVEEIGKDAFLGAKLDKFKFSTKDNVALNKIGQSAFKGTKLVEVDLSKALSLKEIGANVFQLCEELTTVKLNNNITKIGANAFDGCKKLNSFVYDFSKLEGISQYAFRKCEVLTLTLNLNSNVYKGIVNVQTDKNSIKEDSPHITVNWL